MGLFAGVTGYPKKLRMGFPILSRLPVLSAYSYHNLESNANNSLVKSGLAGHVRMYKLHC